MQAAFDVLVPDHEHFVMRFLGEPEQDHRRVPDQPHSESEPAGECPERHERVSSGIRARKERVCGEKNHRRDLWPGKPNHRQEQVETGGNTRRVPEVDLLEVERSAELAAHSHRVLRFGQARVRLAL